MMYEKFYANTVRRSWDPNQLPRLFSSTRIQLMNSNSQDFDALVMAIRLVMAKWAVWDSTLVDE